MLNYFPDVDQHGFLSECSFKPSNEPFYGIGMEEFYKRFDEILEYYIKKYPKKQPYYDEIMNHRDIVFCHSIPVFTTHLRPANIDGSLMFYEPCNALYTMINKLAHSINKDKRKMDKNIKIKQIQLFNLQMKFMELVNEVMNILTGKKGQLRSLLAGQISA